MRPVRPELRGAASDLLRAVSRSERHSHQRTCRHTCSPACSAQSRRRQMIDDLLPLAERWRPDLVVHESRRVRRADRRDVDSGSRTSPTRSDRLCRRRAACLGSRVRRTALAPVRIHGTAVRRRVRQLVPRHLPTESAVPRRHTRAQRTPMRPVFWTPPFSDTSSWQPDVVHPRIYVTFGTVFNEPGAVFGNAVQAATEVGAQVLVTVGHNGDVHAFDPLPRSVTVAAVRTAVRSARLVRRRGVARWIGHVSRRDHRGESRNSASRRPQISSATPPPASARAWASASGPRPRAWTPYVTRFDIFCTVGLP